MYPTELVNPMKAELTGKGFKELLSADEVDNALKQSGTARPGVVLAIQNAEKKPDQLLTSFAGYDLEAVNKLRTYLLPYPPSSPAIALLKDGKVVHMIERHMIEGRPAQMIAANLMQAFETYC
ncbi:MAG: BrxA/BrxB family bacilliredoxin [Sphingobacteriales bacterium]|nr:MAG: BrxA/BrxB family bacilliredoxin [Sphingobacteriales bacterium]